MDEWLRRVGIVALGLLAAACHDHGPAVSHSTSSSDAAYCLSCHAGHGGAPTLPHAARGDCTSCHELTSVGLFPAPMPHRGGDEAGCALCHATGEMDAPRATHLSDTTCYSCHQAPHYGPWPPVVPHACTSSADDACTTCHLVHVEAQVTCVTCHRL